MTSRHPYCFFWYCGCLSLQNVSHIVLSRRLRNGVCPRNFVRIYSVIDLRYWYAKMNLAFN